MNSAQVADLVIAAMGVIAAFVQTRRNQEKGRSQIRQDVELLNLLPEDSTARDALKGHIDKRIALLISSEEELARSPIGVGIAVTFLVVAIWLAIEAVREGGLWWFLFAPVAFFGIFGLVGLFDSLAKKKRDESGRALDGKAKSIPG
jgi:hypothetical protein